MVALKPATRLLTPCLWTAAAILLLSRCTQAPAPTPTPPPTIKATLLVQVSQDDLRWFRDVAVPKGADAYEFTQLATKGSLKATWYPAFRSHFVEAILEVESKAPYAWLIYVWDEGEKKWEPLPVGADLFSVKDGHVLAWAYTNTSQNPAPPPTATP